MAKNPTLPRCLYKPQIGVVEPGRYDDVDNDDDHDDDDDDEDGLSALQAEPSLSAPTQSSSSTQSHLQLFMEDAFETNCASNTMKPKILPSLLRCG